MQIKSVIIDNIHYINFIMFNICIEIGLQGFVINHVCWIISSLLKQDQET